MERKHGYRYPAAAIDWTAAQRRSYTFGIQSDQHVRMWFAEQRLASVNAANESMSAGIKRCGSVGAWMREAVA